MSDIVKRLQDPPFGTDTSERLLMKSAADHIEALEAALAKADATIKECMEEIDDYIRHEYPTDHPVHERYRKRDFSANPARVYFEARKKLQGK